MQQISPLHPTNPQRIEPTEWSSSAVSRGRRRHRAIRHPLRARLTARQLIAAVVVIWTAALVLPFPVAALSRVVTLPTADGAATLDHCKEQWPRCDARRPTVTFPTVGHDCPFTGILYTVAYRGTCAC